MNYDELTDFEINKMIADSQGVNYKIETVFRNPVPDNKDAYKCLMKKLGPKYIELDYCSNWNHAGALIDIYDINLLRDCKGTTLAIIDWNYIDTYSGYEWEESKDCFDAKYHAIHKNPLRAAMVALLRSQEKENE